ncbi:MAG: inorganic phosphate transporter [Kiritimatiellia bacterium]|nr:inorganic phosphate transporter [Kiritimatiellia bacterium]
MIDLATLAIIVIAVALVLDFFNGVHDAANAIATIVVKRALTPLQAVILGAIANFIGAFIFGVSIAQNIGKGINDINCVTVPLILAALIGAIAWNILTWLWGLPTSSSHALIGGLIGSAIAAAGWKSVIFGGVIKIFAFIFIAPLLGMLGAMIFTTLIIWIFRRAQPGIANGIFSRLQLISAAFYSLGHGTNDAQKTMGIIVMTLYAANLTDSFHVSLWIILSCHAAIALGTAFGGWRIVRTMGTGITKIRSMEGFCAESASALVLLGTAHFGIPVSTTHVIAGGIFGVGSVEGVGKVRWGTARKIIWAWLFTIPATAFCGWAAYNLVALLKHIGAFSF